MLHRDLQRSRQHMSNTDIAESRQVLWELLSHESTMQHCLNIVNATCLASGVECYIEGNQCGLEFQEFVSQTYGKFCSRAIRAFFGYGFVPWILRKDAQGNDIPEVLPDGTFHWETESPPKSDGPPRGSVVQYKVKLLDNVNVKQEQVHIYEFVPPTMGVASSSFLNATVSSPMSQLIIEYKELRQAQIRRAYADAWNTTAKLICKYNPKSHAQDDPSATLMDFADDNLYGVAASLGVPFMPHLSASNLQTRDSQIRKQFEDLNTHVPDVFTLPKDHDITSQVVLQGREDIPFLWDKFQRGVASLTHVPFEMVHSNSGASENTRKTMSSGKIFTNQMLQICKHLEYLCRDVYMAAYSRKGSVRFCLKPFRRMEVENIADLKTLFEIGALTTQHTLDIASLLSDVVTTEGKTGKSS